MPKVTSLLTRRELLALGLLIALAGGFRIAVAHGLPNDASYDDGRVYAQMALEGNATVEAQR